MLTDFVTASLEIEDLFETQAGNEKETRLMAAVDRLNGDVVWGPETLAWGSVGRQEKRTLKFTTRWGEVLKV